MFFETDRTQLKLAPAFALDSLSDALGARVARLADPLAAELELVPPDFAALVEAHRIDLT
jgi:hypothetical protein